VLRATANSDGHRRAMNPGGEGPPNHSLGASCLVGAGALGVGVYLGSVAERILSRWATRKGPAAWCLDGWWLPAPEAGIELAARKELEVRETLPISFITGHGLNIPRSVARRLMQGAPIEFLT